MWLDVFIHGSEGDILRNLDMSHILTDNLNIYKLFDALNERDVGVKIITWSFDDPGFV